MPFSNDAEYDETNRLDNCVFVKAKATAYREVAARLNFSVMDRTDLHYATKDVAKHMANPCGLD